MERYLVLQQGDEVKAGQILGFIEQLGTFMPIEVSCLLSQLGSPWQSVLCPGSAVQLAHDFLMRVTSFISRVAWQACRPEQKMEI